MLGLLGQPGGFEGFSVIEVGDDPGHPAVAEIDQVGDRRARIGAALLPASVETPQEQCPIAEVTSFRDLDPDLSEGLVEVL